MEKILHSSFLIILCTFALAFRPEAVFITFGEMVEWSITAVLKTAVLRGTGGSNPSLSAHNNKKPAEFSAGFFVFI